MIVLTSRRPVVLASSPVRAALLPAAVAVAAPAVVGAALPASAAPDDLSTATAPGRAAVRTLTGLGAVSAAALDDAVRSLPLQTPDREGLL